MSSYSLAIHLLDRGKQSNSRTIPHDRGKQSDNSTLGSVQVIYKHVREGWGVRQEMLILLMWLGGGVGQRENPYVKDLNSYPPEKVF